MYARVLKLFTAFKWTLERPCGDDGGLCYVCLFWYQQISSARLVLESSACTCDCHGDASEAAAAACATHEGRILRELLASWFTRLASACCLSFR